jgi:SulP family sulfate permease
MKLRQYVPILDWLPKYQRKDVRGDLLAGLTVAVMLVPQGMAYGLLAGLPPIYGLYAGIVPLLLYAFFGTSRQLSVGPVALVSLLVLTGVGEFAEPGSPLFISLAISTALIAGIIQIILGGFRLGFLINFLSHPVISGFTSAAAFIIGLSQLKNLFGVDIPRSNRIHEVIGNLIQHIDEIHYPTLWIGLGGIVFIYGLKKISKAIPGALLAVIAGVLIVWQFQLYDQDVAIVGVVPSGLPAFEVPELNADLVQQMLPLALTICLISFIESLAIAKTIEAKHKSYRVIPNQELIALGITKIGGAFFQSYPTTGSFTRSAINDDAGARTGISSIVAAIIISLTLVFLTPMFYYLPKAILASIIVVAVIGLINYKEAVELWHRDRKDFLTLIATFIATLTLGIQDGVFIGVILSIAQIIYQSSRPHVAVLGKLPNTFTYRNIDRFEEAKQHDEILVYRFDSQLYFGNAAYFREGIEDVVAREGKELKVFILEANSITDIDSSGIHELEDVMSFLKNRNIFLYMAGLRGPVRDILEKYGLVEKIGAKNFFLDVHAAVEYYKASSEKEDNFWTREAVQTNVKNKKSGKS